MTLKKQLISFLTLFLLFITTKSQEIIEIPFTGEEEYQKEVGEVTKEKYFQIKGLSLSSSPNYMKVTLNPLHEDPNIHTVLSAYKPEKKDQIREQMSIGYGDKNKMWLTQTQISSDVIISVACEVYPCKYELVFSPEETIELDLGEIVNIYITEENKNMKFTFFAKETMSEDAYANIWAKGSQYIKTTLGGVTEYEKFKAQTQYLVKLGGKDVHEITLTVDCAPGDMISVGSAFFENGLSIGTVYAGEKEFHGYLKRGYIEENCYQIKTKVFEPESLIYIVGSTETKFLQIMFKQDGEPIEYSETTFKEIIMTSMGIEDLETQTMCVKFSSVGDEKEKYSNLKEIVYTLSVTIGAEVNKKTISIMPPLVNGQFYPHLLNVNQQLGLIGSNPKKDFAEINYSLMESIGETELLVYKCDKYPFCSIEEMKEENIEKLLPTNKVTTWSEDKNSLGYEVSPISPHQHVLVVKCNKSSSNFCGFGTLIYTNLDRIKLLENLYNSQLLLADEKDLYVVDYQGEYNVQKIYVDIMVFSGELEVQTEGFDDHIYHKYYSANKVFLSITLTHDELDQGYVLFYVHATKNSYYIIQSSLVREGDDSWLTNELPSGMSYLVTVDPSAQDAEGKLPMRKDVKFENINVDDEVPYLVNFHSLNCKFSVSTKKPKDQYEEEYVPIETIDYYSQDIITSDDMVKYYSLSYDYRVQIIEPDHSNYKKKLCMVFATGVELQKDNQGIVQREIIIPENSPQNIIFNKGLTSIKYLFPLVESSNDMIVKFNLLDKAKYKVNVFFGKTPSLEPYTIESNSIIMLSHFEWQLACKDKLSVCNIIIEVNLETPIDDPEPRLELAIKTIKDSTATYLQKDVMRYDYLYGKQVLHFYTDIGTDESGYVLVNFLRSSGKIYGRIVSKDQEVPDTEPDFRGMFRFPVKDGESLEYENYIKKLYYQTSEVNKCENGCFLLITLELDMQNSNVDNMAHPFTMFIRSAPLSREYIPTISIPAEEYVIGNLVKSDTEDIQINEFYSVFLPHDGDKVIFDLQSNGASLYIRLGQGKQPKRNDADFVLESVGKDTLFSLTKQEIIEKATEKGIKLPNDGSLKDLCMIIGVWTNVTDTVYTTVYAFKVHLAKDESLDIYKINSDQKTLCKTQKISENSKEKFNYRCLFVVEYDFIEAFNNLLLYPVFHDESVFYQMHAHYITEQDYELWNEEVLKNIPTKESQFSTAKTKLDYIYTPHGQLSKYLYVSVVSSKDTIVELMSTFYTTDTALTPNPSTPQLFTLKTEMLALNFPLSDDYIVNIISLAGEAEIHWESTPESTYFLRGRDDKLSLTSNGKGNERLIVNNLKPIPASEVGKEGDTDPGFAFYMTHSVRSIKNFDELILGKSTNFVYSHSDLPIVLYTRLPSIEKNLNIYFNFYELINDKGKQETFIEEKPVEIHASLVRESLVYTIKNNPEIGIDMGRTVKGIYNAALRTGFISMTVEDMKKFNINSWDRPYLYVIVSKTTSGEKLRTYTKVSYEVTVSQENSDIPASEKIYQYGKLDLASEKSVYRLRTSLTKKYMRVEFSANSGMINWAISKTPGKMDNDTFIEWSVKYANGRCMVTFLSKPEENDVLYLTVFHRKNKAKYQRLTNFVFKYINADQVNLIKDYEVKNSEIKVKAKESDKSDTGVDYTLTISPVPGYEKLSVTYLVKFVSQRSKFPDESYETIAITESNELVKEFVNPKVNGDKLELFVYDVRMKYDYIQVIAAITDLTVNEFLAYKGVTSPQEIARKTNMKQVIIFSVIGIVLLCIVGVLVAIILMFNSKNKDLLKKVEKISFQQDVEQKPGSDGGLLLNDDQNALIS